MKLAINGGSPIREKDRFLVFGEPDIDDDDINCVVETIRSGWLSTGSKVRELEDKFSIYKKSKYALGTSSCTSALQMALMSLNLPPMSEIIVPAMTFTASVSSIVHANLKPVLCDVEIKTQNIDYTHIEKLINHNTRGIVVVHFAGLPCNMEKIMEIARLYNLAVIEDAAHCIEGMSNGTHCGTFGDAGCFSLYATKNITTACGEGGILITNNEEIDKFVRVFSLHGMSKGAVGRFGKDGFVDYSVLHPGLKANLSDTAASMAISQLSKIDEKWEKRRGIWNKYKREMRGLPVYLPPDAPKGDKHAYHLFTIQIKDKIRAGRDFVLNAMTKEGIGVGKHYKAIHQHPYYYKTFGYNERDFENAQWISDRTMSLPLSSKLTDLDTDDVIRALVKVLDGCK